MTTYNAISVDCSRYGFGNFSVIILQSEKANDFYLKHPQYTYLQFMFCLPVSDENTPERLAKIAENNAIDHIASFVQLCADEAY